MSPAMDIREQLLAAFEIEHREHLDAIRVALKAQAEARPVDWNDVFRRAHSLKGAARAVDLPPVEGIAHRLETLFEGVLSGDRDFGGPALAASHLALDRIEAFVADVKGGAPVMPDDAMIALDGCLNDAAAPAEPIVERSREPQVTPLAAGPLSAQPSGSDRSEPERAMLRIPAAAIESLSNATHALASVLPGESLVADGLSRLVATSAGLHQRLEAFRKGGRNRPREAERVALGELEADLTTLTRTAQDLSRTHRRVTAEFEAASGRVRTETERLALAPAESVFGGFARAIRDMARSEGREVAVTARGLDLPVDRAMLQVLKDPVLHALRNALSHGAEPPERRRQAGKPATPEIVLETVARGGRLLIGIHDDGPGPDLRRIEAKAREDGLLAPGEVASEERLLALVFEPGLSTAESLDTVAGRGIGLSVVADAARRLNGSVRLTPREPHGASLMFDLPLMASQRAVLIAEAAGSAYALPSAAIERLLRLDPGAIGSIGGRPVIRVGEGEAAITVPVADLGALLGTSAATARAEQFSAILLRSNRRRCVLAVDRLQDVRTLLVLPPPPIGVDREIVTGTVVVGNEIPVLVLDPDGLIARAHAATTQAAEIGAKPYESGDGTMPPARRSTILVVDDSITTRTLEKSILEAAGYRVVVCVDGQDALERLKAKIETIDLVVADVEMPRLDGFGLVKALRAEAELAKLPVILMTSRGATDDVARGLELGADAYLTKQKFDQRELLDTVGQLL